MTEITFQHSDNTYIYKVVSDESAELVNRRTLEAMSLIQAHVYKDSPQNVANLIESMAMLVEAKVDAMFMKKGLGSKIRRTFSYG